MAGFFIPGGIGLGIWEYVLAVLGLLLTPGPTNTLLALAGANAGFWRAIRLVWPSCWAMGWL